jgi:uncharacterized linocin/CFP29 family protein
MGDILRKSYAPITEEAWSELNEHASEFFKTNLIGRKVVNVEGPKGWEFAAVNLGRLEISNEKSEEWVAWGKRVVQPLIEIRVPFNLNQMELDNIQRGCKDPDVDSMLDAAEKLANFEDKAIFEGFANGDIEGILQKSSHNTLNLGNDPDLYPKTVAQAINALQAAGIQGPYELVLGTKPYEALFQSTGQGYPPFSIIQKMIGGNIHLSKSMSGGVLLNSQCGEMTIGQDISIGYVSHDTDTIEFYFTESFTFRVIEPDAAIALQA